MGIDFSGWLNDDSEDSESGSLIGSAWDTLVGSTSSTESDSDQSEPTESNSRPWWKSKYRYDWLTGREYIRMVPMQSAESAPSIEVSVYYQRHREAAAVMARYIEFALRDGWGDRYHIDVSIYDEPVDVAVSDDFYNWVDQHEGTAKDCNLLVADGGGWEVVGGGDTAVCQRAEETASLYGNPLYVVSSNQSAAVGMHEVGHCLGFSHRDGGKIGSSITPMGHYDNSGERYSFRFHPNVVEKEPDIQ